jgi:hypothetical protein
VSDFPTFDNGPRKVELDLLEADVQKSCVRWMRDRGWWARKFSTAERNDLVDYIFGKDTWVEWVEFKRPKGKVARAGKLSPTQVEEHKAMRAAGMTPVVFDDFEEFKGYIQQAEREIADLDWTMFLVRRRRFATPWQRGEDVEVKA